ncbi:MAG: HEPN domain-containing protein [Deltaproteobacteria bacterium]|nr:HEPN domain-containing protein [Deltaproteobacteria bacterium]
MGEDKFNAEKLIKYWLIEAEEALQIADHLLEKKDFSYALFFGHLAIEKILKALYVSRQGKHAPPLHNLVRLAKEAGLELDKNKIDRLINITAFNIEARYPDLKRSFRKKCTPEFTNQQLDSTKEIFQWVRSQLP